ncbi:hypothetical protein [Candidatus Venteria ishoeyi]|uniref:Uncharacterized protein n=1 Tax=Candidatus Venteria ishoeyi TaxID=1899563 RepID=A0A1H6FE25_9GAMM|nr:hypothetical protein [Candidatus Venteria ishoeyi]SEH07275.1 Uncharacterised protein [Candidatus Venteria ishoeyi]
MLKKWFLALLGENWGPKVFTIALIISLIFAWWLVIYSHGVTPHGG